MGFSHRNSPRPHLITWTHKLEHEITVGSRLRLLLHLSTTAMRPSTFILFFHEQRQQTSLEIGKSDPHGHTRPQPSVTIIRTHGGRQAGTHLLAHPLLVGALPLNPSTSPNCANNDRVKPTPDHEPPSTEP